MWSRGIHTEIGKEKFPGEEISDSWREQGAKLRQTRSINQGSKLGQSQSTVGECGNRFDVSSNRRRLCARQRRGKYRRR